jgi:Phosphoinositide phospholipase C, Ca2+-dependent
VFGRAGEAATAFVKVDDPVRHQDSIIRLTQAGYIVRTRADADTWEARSGDSTRLQAALSSGAQLISTDYYHADRRAGQKGWSHYRAALPGGVVAVPSASRRGATR